MEEEEERSKKDIIILAVRVAISLTLALLGEFWLKEETYGFWVNFPVMLVAWLLVSYDIVWEALKNTFKEHEPFDEHMLMSIASLGAFALRLFGIGKDEPWQFNEFFEAVLVMLLYQVGEIFQDLSADRSREAIVSALDLRKQKAKVVQGNSTVEKTPEELVIGDQVLLGKGNKILCDALVLEGEGQTDESSLTGEFLPVPKKKGDHVLSGTILQDGSLRVEVEKEYKDSTVAKLLELVENSADKKSKATRFITKFSRIYTPIVVGLAVLVAVVPPLFLGISSAEVWSDWIQTAIKFLIVSCPCAIVISVPLAYFAGLGLASKKGIIVKGAEYFDKLNDLKTVCFDKTGTLTEGRFQVVDVHPVGMSKEAFLGYMGAVESLSTHPIARAIVSASGKDNLAAQVSNYQEIMAYGVKGDYQGHHLMAGKLNWLNDEGIDLDSKSVPGSVTYLAVDDQYAGYIVLNDVLRPTSQKMVEGLKRRGVHTVLLSGDKQANVDAVGEELGLDEWHGELLPAQKQEFLHKKIDENNGQVAFVGDGINDSPSIVLADVGIAMGGLGSDVAVANADVVLMNDDPAKVVTVYDIARKAKNRATFDIVVSLILKIGVMVASTVLTVLGMPEALPMWVAVLADSGLAVVLVFASLLLFYSKVD